MRRVNSLPGAGDQTNLLELLVQLWHQLGMPGDQRRIGERLAGGPVHEAGVDYLANLLKTASVGVGCRVSGVSSHSSILFGISYAEGVSF
jgi:hypothetical protein